MFAAGANVVSVDGYVLWFPGCHIWFPGYHGMNKKCEFLTNRIKYVGHNITPNVEEVLRRAGCSLLSTAAEAWYYVWPFAPWSKAEAKF